MKISLYWTKWYLYENYLFFFCFLLRYNVTASLRLRSASDRPSLQLSLLRTWKSMRNVGIYYIIHPYLIFIEKKHTHAFTDHVDYCGVTQERRFAAFLPPHSFDSQESLFSHHPPPLPHPHLPHPLLHQD